MQSRFEITCGKGASKRAEIQKTCKYNVKSEIKEWHCSKCTEVFSLHDNLLSHITVHETYVKQEVKVSTERHHSNPMEHTVYLATKVLQAERNWMNISPRFMLKVNLSVKHVFQTVYFKVHTAAACSG